PLLTKQLPAFGKRQAIHGVPIDLNDLVRGLERTVRQVAGAGVKVELCLCPGQAVVNADPGQLEQVLLNLVANGRDAMKGGGVLRISRGHQSIDQKSGYRTSIT